MTQKITAQMVIKVLTRNATVDDSPERKLWLAVLGQTAKDTTDDYQRRNAIHFLNSKWYAEACDLVGVDPETTREMIDKISPRNDEIAISLPITRRNYEDQL